MKYFATVLLELRCNIKVDGDGHTKHAMHLRKQLCMISADMCIVEWVACFLKFSICHCSQSNMAFDEVATGTADYMSHC